MSNHIISSSTQGSFVSFNGPNNQNAQTPKRSFETVLNSPKEVKPEPAITENVRTDQLEQLRSDLIKRLDKLSTDSPFHNNLLTEVLDTRTRFGLLKEAMIGINSPGKTSDIKGRFAQIENEWYQLEGIMKSDKDLSTGELLGLQARLYQVSQHIEVLSKAVDQVTNGIKTVLNTNV
jgi:hypothetical protein